MEMNFSVENYFVGKLSTKETMQILKDIAYIKARYLKERGIFRALNMSTKKIMNAFSEYNYCCEYGVAGTIGQWENFMQAFRGDGISFLDMYIWAL